MIISIDYSLLSALKVCQFSTIQKASQSYVASILAATFTMLHELGIIAYESGLERSVWIQGVIAESHYSDLPALQTEFDECGLVIAESVAVTHELDYIDAEFTVIYPLSSFSPIALLMSAVDMMTSHLEGNFPENGFTRYTDLTVKALKALCKERGIKFSSKAKKIDLALLLAA